jgi:AcrR family transcriptional regulator
MSALGADPTIRRQVVAAARTVLAADARAPVAQIASAAGVSRATFYRHFGSRGALLATIDHDPPPEARQRILEAAQEVLLATSLADLSMDELALAAGVSRGTLYRLFPGKPALLRSLIETYSPFEAMLSVLAAHRDQPPAVVLPLISRAVVGVAERRLGLMRAVFHEATSGSPTAMAGVRPVLVPALGAMADYMSRQMGAGRVRRMVPLLALQAFIGPIYFHLMTRQVAGQVADLHTDVEAAVDELVRVTLAGLVPVTG